MSIAKRTTSPSFTEFIIILSLMMSLTALSIDTMLPALSEIANDLAATNANDRQLVISIIFLGQGFGQLFFGPLSDKTGRKPAILAGYVMFIIGSIISVVSVNFPMMLVGRTLQGLGVSAPRAVSLAIVRDMYEGRTMARIMSFAMTVFILVPVIAPTFGQAILSFAGWRSIFKMFIGFALVSLTWFLLRVPETLAPENRKPFSIKQITRSTLVILKTRSAIGFTIATGLINGFFLGYLNSAQQIFQEQYALGDKFPIIFAVISLSLGSASFLNSRLVMRFGMTHLVRWASKSMFVLTSLFLGVALLFAGQPPLWLMMGLLMLIFFSIGILFGNMNALAMQPLGNLAGIGAAVVGSISTLLSMVLGTLIGQNYNGTILPLVIGMATLSGLGILVVNWSLKEED